MVSPTWRVMDDSCSSKLHDVCATLSSVDQTTLSDCFEAVASVRICTTVVVCGELLLQVNPSVFVPVALAIPLAVSSESVGLPQSPFVAPVNRVTCDRSSSIC